MIEDLKITPTKIIILEMKDEDVFRILGSRQVDLETGFIYDCENQAKCPKVQSRLQPLKSCTKEKIEIRLSRWKDTLKSLEQMYSAVIVRLSGSEKSLNILEQISFALEN